MSYWPWFCELQERLEVLESRDREQSAQLERQAKRIAELERENQQLRQKLGQHPTQRLDEAYSLRSEEQRREAASRDGVTKRKQKSARRGRISTDEKLALATRHEDIWPSDRPHSECHLRYSRPVWRIINGQAVLVAYHIHAGSCGRVPQIPGVPQRGEYGSEIITELAFQHYITGLPLGTVIGEFALYWNLTLRKSQADAMLNRLAKEWLPEFDALCQLLAVSAVVSADETSWSINSVWAFLSEQARLTIFGCRKDGPTLAVLLKKETFAGKLVSDDAAVYQGFSCAQKCWAHLLRKAIRLTLLAPDRPQYRECLDSLLKIYRKGKAIAADKRLSEAGRRTRVAALFEAVLPCTKNRTNDETPPSDDTERDFMNLTHEINRLLIAEELFTYAISPEVDGTNNISERQLRQPAQARLTGQTNKTALGARRRTIISSVLDSLRLHLLQLTLKSVQAEFQRWQETGQSVFRRLVRTLNLPDRSCQNRSAPRSTCWSPSPRPANTPAPLQPASRCQNIARFTLRTLDSYLSTPQYVPSESHITRGGRGTGVGRCRLIGPLPQSAFARVHHPSDPPRHTPSMSRASPTSAAPSAPAPDPTPKTPTSPPVPSPPQPTPPPPCLCGHPNQYIVRSISDQPHCVWLWRYG